jgi:hypothetical protein
MQIRAENNQTKPINFYLVSSCIGNIREKFPEFGRPFRQISHNLRVQSNSIRRAHMSALSTLKLVAAKKPQHLPTIQLRRNKLSNKLWEQIQLAKSQITGEPFVVTRFRSVKDPESGLRRQVEMPKRMRPWWFVTENGKVCVSIRYGSWTIELAKGKPSVEVANADELVVALETIKQAVEAGELDAQIETASASLKSGFKR